MPSTVNKGYAVPTTGTEVGTWGDDLNNNSFATIDLNMGGIVTKTVAGSNITLTSDEAKNCIVRLIGAQSADVQVTSSCIGFYFVENLTTNAFNITVTNGIAGVVIPKGRATVIADPTNGCRIASADSIPSGTPMLFKQTSAPTGWTKDTANDNAALRVVSGTPGTGGTVNFTAAFASQAVTGTVGDTTLTINQMPLHGHPTWMNTAGGTTTASGGLTVRSAAEALKPAFTGTPNGTNGEQIGGTGGGQSHTHTFTGTAINLAVKYVDFIVATRN